MTVSTFVDWIRRKFDYAKWWVSSQLIELIATGVVLMLLAAVILPLYVIWGTSKVVGNLANIVLEQEKRYIIERTQQAEYNKTIKARVDALTDEQRWIREQAPVSRSYSRTQQVTATLTFFTCGPESTGKRLGDPGYCVTASGYKLKPSDAMTKVAADTRYYKFGQRIHIDGIGPAVVVDTGGDIKGANRFDVYVGEDVGKAMKLGKQIRKVTVVE